MSKATKRKHVVKEVLQDYVQPSGNQRIVRVLGSPGNNLHEIETAEGERFLASMPTKFRKNIWIKRGDFVIVDPIAEGEKVKAEISFIIYKDHQRLLQNEGLWPQGFANEATDKVSKQNGSNKGTDAQSSTDEKSQADNCNSDSEDDSDLFVNTNRVYYEDSEDESDSEENSEEDEGEKE